MKWYRMRSAGGKLHLAHRLRAERALGKPLPLGAEVHHADWSKRDDAMLVICPDHAYHALLHVRMRVIRASGNPNTERICNGCKQLKPIEEFQPAAAAQGSWQCKRCPVKAQRYAGWGPEKAAKQRQWRRARKRLFRAAIT
ncbi:MAG TPA: hypothetical protein VGQ19_19535 [Burkholderiales bacterium]|nr:hypothetical protein [Burkholderiales bacterium]